MFLLFLPRKKQQDKTILKGNLDFCLGSIFNEKTRTINEAWAVAAYLKRVTIIRRKVYLEYRVHVLKNMKVKIYSIYYSEIKTNRHTVKFDLLRGLLSAFNSPFLFIEIF